MDYSHRYLIKLIRTNDRTDWRHMALNISCFDILWHERSLIRALCFTFTFYFRLLSTTTTMLIQNGGSPLFCSPSLLSTNISHFFHIASTGSLSHSPEKKWVKAWTDYVSCSVIRCIELENLPSALGGSAVAGSPSLPNSRLWLSAGDYQGRVTVRAKCAVWGIKTWKLPGRWRIVFISFFWVERWWGHRYPTNLALLIQKFVV